MSAADDGGPGLLAGWFGRRPRRAEDVPATDPPAATFDIAAAIEAIVA